MNEEKMAIIGLKRIFSQVIGFANFKLSFAGLFTAKDFGKISPKMMISTVITAVAIPTPDCPKRLRATDVAKEDEKVFTKLLPIKINVRRLSVFCFNFRTGVAAFLFSLSICRILILDKLKKAVSLWPVGW